MEEETEAEREEVTWPRPHILCLGNKQQPTWNKLIHEIFHHVVHPGVRLGRCEKVDQGRGREGFWGPISYLLVCRIHGLYET